MGFDKTANINDENVCSGCFCCIDGCISCSSEECWGCSVDALCCCIKENGYGCKVVDEKTDPDGKCLICFQGGCYCVEPQFLCTGQRQFFCLDSRCNFPPSDEVPKVCTLLPCCTIAPKFACFPKVSDLFGSVAQKEKVQAKEKEKDLSDVPVSQILVCGACICEICGFVANWPECLGAKFEGVCLCMQAECAGCKPIPEKNEDGVCCIWEDGGCYCVKVTQLCQYQSQFFCMDARAACPPGSDKVPMMCTLLPGCVVFPKFACCAKAAEITGQA
mmetsp:Transcript_110587/g.174219  ORF Transcript_110587/g.174219 Transcript_110587/m.174219 type:complete len:275 (-) Transcript_110587:92-916(-)|eukprot:CAMPEP_0169117212 /NCGR_PEP_ID=MMETSP1015-20121227/30335_1 /TAXON_ID=342587 /ORGANISM="Karlodinium micrum, Strain CCMP2283" /LENGTH=274 /DNA_ID=CAMNT_0009179875 /DNA_START=79 /DNA_END=903 /DNA_ORIENTATION=-